jgi:ankyrin repeat protein
MKTKLKAVLARIRYAELPVFEGVEVDGPNVRGRSFGDTPLHIVAIWGDVEAARVLIASGAEIDARGEDDFTPLHNAVEQGHTEVVELLLDAGANPRLLCRAGDAFSLVVHDSNPALIAALKKKEPNQTPKPTAPSGRSSS